MTNIKSRNMISDITMSITSNVLLFSSYYMKNTAFSVAERTMNAARSP